MSCTCTVEDMGVKTRILTFKNCSFKRKRNNRTKWHKEEKCCPDGKGGVLAQEGCSG